MQFVRYERSKEIAGTSIEHVQRAFRLLLAASRIVKEISI
jgi:hypothetical protein